MSFTRISLNLVVAALSSNMYSRDVYRFDKDDNTMELIIKAIKEEECLKGVVQSVLRV